MVRILSIEGKEMRSKIEQKGKERKLVGEQRGEQKCTREEEKEMGLPKFET